MNQKYIIINNIELLTSVAFMAIVILLSYIEKMKLEKDLIVGTLRCFVQLMAVGYVLRSIFQANKWYWVALIIIVMITVAGIDAIRREKKKSPYTLPIVIGAIAAATISIMTLVVLFIVKVDYWYNPQYIIPMMGMLIGNSMNGASLLINRLKAEIKNNKDKIEARLSLGATSKEAVGEHLRDSIQAAMIPSINSLMVVGLVSLPGMMTGQIIAGADPADSVRYQVVIMYMISASTAITVFITALLSYRQFFSKDFQIKEELL